MTNLLEEVEINVKVKLSGLWITVMFLYIYADYFSLYQPGHLEDIMSGEIAGFDINQSWLLGVMILLTIPSLMIFLSLALKSKANRWANIIVGILQILTLIAAVIGESNYYYIFATIVETVLLLLIIWYAWNWPTRED